MAKKATDNGPATKAHRPLKIVVEKHRDSYVAYPLSIQGAVIGQGETYEAALASVKQAIKFHIETWGPDILKVESPVIEIFVAELEVAG